MGMLTLSIDKTDNVPVLVGGTNTFTLKIRNTSDLIRLYNLNIYLTLPDGMSFYSATISETSKITFSDGGTKISWINLKDLVPMEKEYSFDITIKGNTTFKSGTNIPFGYIFNGINIKCEMDTMPRGEYDDENEKKSAEANMTFKAARFYNNLSTSSKVLKGAGTSILTNDYTKTYSVTCRFFNNAISTSTINVTILLENGIRYLGNITVSGTDAQSFQYPQITYVNINNKQYTQLYYGNVTLSKNSNTTVTFKYAVWNRYNENTGEIINHGTKINILSNMSSVDDSVDNEISFLAMDLIISTNVNKQSVDIDDVLQFSYTYELGGYYDMQDINVDYILPDGISYLSSSVEPYFAQENPEVKGFELKYKFDMAIMNSLNTVKINGKVDGNYRYKFDDELIQLPVVAFDGFTATTSIVATKIQSLTTVGDASITSCNIKLPTILKEFLNGYYRDNTVKNINYLAPGDLAEYRLTYNSVGLKAIQKQIYLDDFFPLAANPIDDLNYIISGYSPIDSPKLISPHGVDFYYGNVLGNSMSTITFKVPIEYLGSPSENINLFKLKGLNTEGISYSNRTQIAINVGSPNIQLTKTVTGPNKNAIKYGEIYIYTVKILNTNTLGNETDAFDFVLYDEFSPWFTVNTESISVTGNGNFGTPIYDQNNIQVPIYKLSPGSYVTLTYSVTINSLLAPGVSIKTIASNTNPYSQVYKESLENYQYSNLNKTASTTLTSQNITISKTNNADIFKVGSEINYTITVTIPLGTVVYDLYVKDTLSNGNQIYNGIAFRNGIPIIPTVINNVITLPNEGYIDARDSAQVISYMINCKVIKGSKTISTITSAQSNTAQVLFKQKLGAATWITLAKTLNVTINYPNIVMNLSAKDREGSGGYSTSNNVLVGSILDFRLDFNNNSKIDLVNGTIEVAISSKFIFNSISIINGCTAVYDNTTNKIIISIERLQPSIWGFIIFNVTCLSNLRAGSTIDTQGVATKYYNDISPNTLYGGEQSNICKTILPTGISLLPNPSDRIDDSTSYRVTKPGSVMTILNYLKNNGGGYDDYSLSINSVDIPYVLYIDEIKIADVSANIPFYGEPDILKNMEPEATRIIKIVSTIPTSSPLGCRYNFIVKGKSKTSPYPEKTVLNIDPS